MTIDPIDGREMEAAETVERWLDGLLMDSLMVSDDIGEEHREFRYQAARALVEELAPAEGAEGVRCGLAERVIAVHFASAQAAALEWQGRAVSRFLPEKTRETAQRFANSLYTIVKGQAATLSRLAETRRKAETETRREARLEAVRKEWEETERRETEGRAALFPARTGQDGDAFVAEGVRHGVPVVDLNDEEMPHRQDIVEYGRQRGNVARRRIVKTSL